MLVHVYQTTQCQNLEDHYNDSHHHDELKSHASYMLVLKTTYLDHMSESTIFILYIFVYIDSLTVS